MSSDFNAQANLRAAIIKELRAIGFTREIGGVIEPGSADDRAHDLILQYLRDVIESNEIADAFAAAVGHGAITDASRTNQQGD